MSIASADIETDLFYVVRELAEADHMPAVMRRGLAEVRETDNALSGVHTENALVCIIPPSAPEGAAEQIARALNRLPKAEAILIDVVQAIREADGGHNQLDSELLQRADAVEEWMVS